MAEESRSGGPDPKSVRKSMNVKAPVEVAWPSFAPTAASLGDGVEVHGAAPSATVAPSTATFTRNPSSRSTVAAKSRAAAGSPCTMYV